MSNKPTHQAPATNVFGVRIVPTLADTRQMNRSGKASENLPNMRDFFTVSDKKGSLAAIYGQEKCSLVILNGSYSGFIRQRRKFTRMSYEHEPISPMFRIDVSAETESAPMSLDRIAIDLLRQLAAGQQQQIRLLEELVHQQVAVNKQRASELQQWKNANPELARSCRRAAETLSRVQTQFLDVLTEEVADSEDHLIEGEFMLNEFVDRFGPRLAHLNGVLQVLAQLGSADATA
jgi:hypothetical protein